MQTKKDIALEIFNSYLNGKAARLELWQIGMNPHNPLPETMDLWLAWRLGWAVIDDEMTVKKQRLLNF